ncbi:MAG TPA: hypothetical protein VF267_12900 [Gammaproteobacteria bacterium]
MKRISRLAGVLPAVLLAGCSIGPGGVLGVTWDMAAGTAAERFSMQCEAWTQLRDTEFRYCEDHDVMIRDHRVDTVVLTSHDGLLAGVSLWFHDCDEAKLPLIAIREMGLEPKAVNWWSWRNGQLVRLRTRTGMRCEFIVTNAAYGREYSASQRSGPFNFWH